MSVHSAVLRHVDEVNAARDLELRTAERDRAIDLLDRFERAIGKLPGFQDPALQQLGSDVRAFLVEQEKRPSTGLYPPVTPAWARKP